MPEEEGINRKVHFAHANAFLPEDTSGVNNTWVYHRAPEGYLFLLDSVTLSNAHNPYTTTGIFAVYDGHEYTHWNQFPGVESRELLARFETSSGETQIDLNLHGWECKEYTIGIRSLSESVAYKICAIMWFWLKKASRKELMEYAIKHPIREDTFKRAMRGSTLTEGEET